MSTIARIRVGVILAVLISILMLTSFTEGDVRKGLFTNGDLVLQKIDKYGSKTVYLGENQAKKEEILSMNPKNIFEHHNNLLHRVTDREKIMVHEYHLLDLGDRIIYSISVDENEDLKIYSHILGPVKEVKLFSPDRSLYKTYDYISPDTPIVIQNAIPGKWKIEFEYLSLQDALDLNVGKSMLNVLYTPISVVITTAPTEVTKEDVVDVKKFKKNILSMLRSILNDPSLHSENYREHIYFYINSRESIQVFYETIERSTPLTEDEYRASAPTYGTSPTRTIRFPNLDMDFLYSYEVLLIFGKNMVLLIDPEDDKKLYEIIKEIDYW